MTIKRRKLSSSEKALFPQSFRNEIKIGNVTLIDKAHNVFATSKILTRNNDIYWPGCPEDFTKATLSRQALLMHELCQVWQYHTGRLTAFIYLNYPRNWFYEYVFHPSKKFDDYPTEEQADLLQDWYRVNRGYDAKYYDKEKSIKPTQAQLNIVVPFTW